MMYFDTSAVRDGLNPNQITAVVVHHASNHLKPDVSLVSQTNGMTYS